MSPASRILSFSLVVLGLVQPGLVQPVNARSGEPRPLPRREQILQAQPLLLPAAAKVWLARSVPAALPAEDRLRRLVEAVLGNGPVGGTRGLGLREIDDRTGTAAEAFHDHQANCVALAQLLVALGREIDLPLYFVLGVEIEGRGQRAGFHVATGHLAVGYGPDAKRQVLDFGGITRPPRQRFVRIDDRQARAVFLANRGAELLLAGDSELAVVWLEEAVEQAPDWSWGWRNLAVALRRSGRMAAAELVQRRVCELAASSLPRRGAQTKGERCLAP